MRWKDETPKPPFWQEEGGGAMEEFILLSYDPICVSGTDRINLGKGKVGGAWKSLSYYPIILYVFVGSDRTDFSKNPRFR